MNITKEEYDAARRTVIDYELHEYESGLWERGLFHSANGRQFEGKRNRETNEYFMIIRNSYVSKDEPFQELKVLDYDIIIHWHPFEPKIDYNFTYFSLWKI